MPDPLGSLLIAGFCVPIAIAIVIEALAAEGVSMSPGNISAIAVGATAICSVVGVVLYVIFANDPDGVTVAGLLGIAGTCIGVLAKSPIGPDQVQVVNTQHQPVPVEEN